MCADDCTHGQCIYLEPGLTFATWPAADTDTTDAVFEVLKERGIHRGRE